MGAISLLVLAGGFGTRLRSEVKDVPKPLAPVAGKPFLAHMIANWKAQGVTQLFLLLHFEHQKICAMVDAMENSGELDGMKVHTLIETVPLGTGGAVVNAIDVFGIKSNFLLTNADTWLGSGITELASACPNSIGIVKVQNTQRYGAVQVDNGKILRFSEKSQSVGNGWVNAGLYHLVPDVFKTARKNHVFSIETDVFPKLVEQRMLAATPLETDFIDIGIPDDYHCFCRWVETGRQVPLCS